MALLDDEDVAYLRDTQADTFPTAALLFAKTGSEPDGMGGYTDAYPTSGTPVQVRLSMAVDKSSGGDVPVNLAQKYEATDLVRVHLPVATPVHVHDRIVADGVSHLAVSDGFSSEWTTAQILWAVIET